MTLRGDGSSFLTEYGYRLGGEQKLDVNCEAIHLGKRAESRINASGVLEGRAFKLLRGTIDLRRGCSAMRIADEGDRIDPGRRRPDGG